MHLDKTLVLTSSILSSAMKSNLVEKPAAVAAVILWLFTGAITPPHTK